MRSLLFLLLLVSPHTWAQTQLTAGELAVVRYCSADPDELSFLLLSAVDSGTVIRFTDNGWTDADSFRQGEGFFQWVADKDYACQEVISLDSLLPMQFSTTGDQVLVFQGPVDTPQFITAINLEGNGIWQTNASSSSTSALPKGLSDGVNAMALWESDNMIYGDSLAGSMSAISTWVFDANRYKLSDSLISAWDTTFSITGSCVLPVELLYAKAEVKQGQTVFSWATASEWNSARFVLELARSDKEFLPIGWRDAAGYSVSIRNYELWFSTVATGRWRLRQVDRDGKEQLFGPFVLGGKKLRASLRYAPGAWFLTLDRPVQVVIRSIEGELINSYEGSGELRIDQADYLPGCYLLEIKSQREWTRQLIQRLP